MNTPEHLINNDKFIETKVNSASLFNEFSTNVGPDLDKNILYSITYKTFTIIILLTHICNTSFKTGVFPEKLQIAKIIHTFKAGNKENGTNY